MADQTPSQSQPQLVEFVQVKLWAEDSKRKLEELYRELVPSIDEFRQAALKQLEEVLKPRPRVRPIIKCRRRVELSNSTPVPSCPSLVVPSVESGPIDSPDTLSVNPDDYISTSGPSNSLTSPPPHVVPGSSQILTTSPFKCDTSRKPCPKSVRNSLSNIKENGRLVMQPNRSKQTARKSTTGRVKQPSLKQLMKRQCRISVIDLKASNISKLVSTKLKQYGKERSKREEEMKKIQERKESTDSGVASEEDDSTLIPPIRINLYKNEHENWTQNMAGILINDTIVVKTQPAVRAEKKVENLSTNTTTTGSTQQKIGKEKIVEPLLTKKRVKPSTSTTCKPPPSYHAKKRKNEEPRMRPSFKKKFSKENFALKSFENTTTDGATAATKRVSWSTPKVSKKCNSSPKGKEPPKIPPITVSIPWNEHLRIIFTVSSRQYIRNNIIHDDTDNRDKTVLPKDVVPAAEFNLDTIQMLPLACKRYKEPAPLQFFSPYQGHPFVCVGCNQSFPSEPDLARHELANHRSYNF